MEHILNGCFMIKLILYLNNFLDVSYLKKGVTRLEHVSFGLATRIDILHTYRYDLSASSCEGTIILRWKRRLYSGFEFNGCISITPPNVDQLRRYFHNGFLIVTPWCCDSFKLITVPEVPFSKNRQAAYPALYIVGHVFIYCLCTKMISLQNYYLWYLYV